MACESQLTGLDRLYIDPGEPIRVRVDSLEWQDVRPKPYVPEPDRPVANGHVNGHPNGDGNEAADTAEPKEREEDSPMRKAGLKIIAGITESGLGITSWWSGEADGGAEQEGGEGGAYDPEEMAMEGMA